MSVSTVTLKVCISIGDSLTSKYGATTGLKCSVDPARERCEYCQLYTRIKGNKYM